jgi:ribosomal-protein-alanine N-acetyltransferase
VSEPVPIAIRPGAAADLTRVVAIEQASFDDPWPDATLRAELSPDPTRLSLVAEQQGELVGYLMAWPVGVRLHVLNIAVDPAARRAGVGSELIRTAAVTAARRQLLEMTLEVRRSNAEARGFYRRFGFRERGVRAGYYPNNGEDAVMRSCPVVRLLAGREPDRDPGSAAG